MSISKIVKLSFVVYMICSCQSYAQEVRDTGNTIIESENTASQNNMFNMEILGRGFSNGGGFSGNAVVPDIEKF